MCPGTILRNLVFASTAGRPISSSLFVHCGCAGPRAATNAAAAPTADADADACVGAGAGAVYVLNDVASAAAAAAAAALRRGVSFGACKGASAPAPAPGAPSVPGSTKVRAGAGRARCPTDRDAVGVRAGELLRLPGGPAPPPAVATPPPTAPPHAAAAPRVVGVRAGASRRPGEKTACTGGGNAGAEGAARTTPLCGESEEREQGVEVNTILVYI